MKNIAQFGLQLSRFGAHRNGPVAHQTLFTGRSTEFFGVLMHLTSLVVRRIDCVEKATQTS
jgi:hypothetical protein